MTDDDLPCPQCGGPVYNQFTFTGFVHECANCDWYDPDP